MYKKRYCITPSVGTGGGIEEMLIFSIKSFFCDRQGGVMQAILYVDRFCLNKNLGSKINFNPIALRKAKIVYMYNFGLSECKRVNMSSTNFHLSGLAGQHTVYI